MKKIYLWLILSVFIVSSVFLAACADKNKDEEQGAPTGEILLYDFEDYDRNFQLMRVMSYFGRVNVNENTEFVKSGNVSAELNPLGWHSTMIANNFTGVQPECVLYIPLTSNKYEFDFSDLSKISRISFSIYNAESEDVNLYISMLFDLNAAKMSVPSTFVLHPGWNEIFYLPDHDSIAIKYDIKTCYGIGLAFDRVGSRDVEDAPVLYLDDLFIITRALADQAKTIRIPVHMVESINKQKRETRKLFQVLGREPSAQEISTATGLPVEKVLEIQKISQDVVSLSSPVGTEEESELSDFIEDKAVQSPNDYVTNLFLKKDIELCLKQLTPREEKVIRLRYGIDDAKPRTLEDVGKIFNVTRERIRQIEAKALRKLRSPTRSRILKNY